MYRILEAKTIEHSNATYDVHIEPGFMGYESGHTHFVPILRTHNSLATHTSADPPRTTEALNIDAPR
jgi:hypothetical protein